MPILCGLFFSCVCILVDRCIGLHSSSLYINCISVIWRPSGRGLLRTPPLRLNTILRVIWRSLRGEGRFATPPTSRQPGDREFIDRYGPAAPSSSIADLHRGLLFGLTEHTRKPQFTPPTFPHRCLLAPFEYSACVALPLRVDFSIVAVMLHCARMSTSSAR